MKGLPSGAAKICRRTRGHFRCRRHADRLPRGRAAGGHRRVNSRAQASAAATGLLLATDVADYLVRRGVPFRRAHEISGGLVRKLLAEGRDFDSLSVAEWRAASEFFDADIAAHVTSSASVAAKRTPQSTAPSAVARALAEAQSWVARVSG